MKTASNQTLTPAERYVVATVQSLRTGTVEIVVHDGRIAQVQVSEQFRFDDRSRGAPPPATGP